MIFNTEKRFNIEEFKTERKTDRRTDRDSKGKEGDRERNNDNKTHGKQRIGVRTLINCHTSS